MEQVLARIRDGSFARKWMEESRAGSPNLEKLRNGEASLEQEAISTSIRSMMKA
jgi:ketol-acid reductoisomerase